MTNGHRTTDPACRFYREPVGWLARRRFDRARGRECRACYLDALSLERVRRVVDTLGMDEARLVLSADDLVRLEISKSEGVDG